MDRIATSFKLFFGVSFVALGAFLQSCILLLLLPSRLWRIRSCFFFARFVGHGGLWIMRCPLKVVGREHVESKRPAIYMINHTSIIDLFVVMKLMPWGSVGIAKKEIVLYPFFGQMYMLTAIYVSTVATARSRWRR